MTKYSLILLMILGCSTGKKTVNEPKYTLPLIAAATIGGAKTPVGGVDPGPKTPAMAGTVMLKSQIPQPLAHISLGLFKQNVHGWEPVLELSTSADGSFKIIRGLEPGKYELRVQNPKYEGTTVVTLTEPIQNLVVEVTKKEKK